MLYYVIDKFIEDWMESFFFSEICKYLYLLFDEDNLVYKFGIRYMFIIEGYIVFVDEYFWELLWKEFFFEEGGQD